MSRAAIPPPPPGFDLVDPSALPPLPPGFSLVNEQGSSRAKGPGIIRRTLEAAKGMVESEASYQRRLEAGEVQTSGLGQRWNQLASAAVLGSPGNVGEALNSPEFNEVVAPMGARMGPPMMTALAATPQGRAVTALNTGMTVAAGYTGDMLAQWMENQQGLRDGYSVREAAGNAAAAPVFLSRLPVGATLPRAAVQGGVEGSTMITASALAAGRDLTPEEFLAAGLLGSAFRTVTQAPAREALRKSLYEQAQNLGYQGKGSMRDMRRWYERTMESRRVDRMKRVQPEEPVRPVAEIEAGAGPQARAGTPASPPPAAPTPTAPPPPAGFVPVPAAPVAPVAGPAAAVAPVAPQARPAAAVAPVARADQPAYNLPARAESQVQPRPAERLEGENGRDFAARRDQWDDEYGDMRSGGRTHNDDGTPYQPTVFDDTISQVNAAKVIGQNEEVMLGAIGTPSALKAGQAVKELVNAGWVWDAKQGRMVNPANPSQTPYHGLIEARRKVVAAGDEVAVAGPVAGEATTVLPAEMYPAPPPPPPPPVAAPVAAPAPAPSAPPTALPAVDGAVVSSRPAPAGGVAPVVVEPTSAKVAEVAQAATPKELKVQKEFLVDALTQLAKEAPKTLVRSPELQAKIAEVQALIGKSGAVPNELLVEYGLLLNHEGLPGKRARALRITEQDVIRMVELREGPYITIKVPGDGTFKVRNEQGAIEALRDRVKEQFGRGLASRGPTLPGTSARPIAALKAKPGTKEAERALQISASADENRTMLKHVVTDGPLSVSTDGRRLTVTKGAHGYELNPNREFSVKEGGKTETVQFPNWRQVVPKGFVEINFKTGSIKQVGEATLMADTEEVLKILARVRPLFEGHSGHTKPTVRLHAAEGGGLGISYQNADGDVFLSEGVRPGQPVLQTMDPDFLADAMTQARLLGSAKVPMHLTPGDGKPIQAILGKDTWTTIMPVRGTVDVAPTLDEPAVPAKGARAKGAGGTSSTAELRVTPGRAEAVPPRPARRNRQAEREAALPPYRADAPLLYQTSKGAYVQVPLARLDGIPIVQMPELVRLVQTLSGERPDIKKLRRALGIFRPGTGKIALDPRIFQDSVTATKVLAHEIGHFLDWLPHESLERGNILGRMASLKGYMVSTIPHRPRSTAQAITAKERQQLYAKANSATTAKLGRRPKKDGEDADPAGWDSWGVERSKIYREMVEAEIEKRGLIRADAVRQELIDLSDHWKPFREAARKGEVPQSYIDYRESSVELYADAISVLFNSPATLQEMAPLFYDGFFAYLRNKPEVFKALLSTWELLGGRQKALLDLRDTELRAAARNAEEIWRRKAAEREARANTGWRGWVDGLRAELEDIYHPLLKREAAARAAGKPVPVDKSPTVLFEEFALSDNAPYRYLQRLHETVVKELDAAGISWEDYGLYLFHNRILNERLPLTPEGIGGGRSMVANPGGITPEAARLGLLNWRLNHGLDRYQALLRADAAFRRLTDEITQDAVQSGVYSRKTYEELIKPNLDNYATFAVVDYLSESVPASIKVGQGTFKDVANPATATVLKMLSLRRWIQRNDTVRYTTGWMREFAPDEIRPAETKWDMAKRRHVPVDPPRDSGMVLLEEFVDGAKVGHYVPRDVARMFEDISPGRMSAIIKPFNWFFREGVYPMWITFNPYFQLFSGPARDMRRNIRNMPGASGLRVGAEFAANYGTLLGETGAAIVRVAGRIPGLGPLRGWRPNVPMTPAARAARAHLRGESDPLANEMMEVGGLGTPMDNFRSGFFKTEDVIQRQMERLKLLPPAGRKWDLNRVLRSFLYGVEHAGLTFEMLAKTAPYQVMRDRGATPREAAHFVRNYTGVPNYRKRGRYTREVGSMFPFFNVFLRGYSADLELAFKGQGKTGSARPAGAGSRTGWWLRYFSGSGFWSVLKAMAKLGLLGAGAKVAWDRIGDFDNTNFTTIPLGEVDGGEIDGKKTMYLRLPEDETDRLLSAFLYKSILMLGGAQTQGRNVLAFGAEQLPTINPLVTLAEGWSSWLSGYNPRDGFRNSPVLTNDVWLEGGWPAFRDMTLWTAQETGAANFFRYDPRANTTLEVTLNSVPGLGRVLKVSDAGLLQAQAEGELDERRDGAVFRNSLPEDVARLRRSYYWLQRLGREGRSIEQESRYLELMIWKRSVYDPMEAAVLDLGRKRLTREEARWLKQQSEPFADFRN